MKKFSILLPILALALFSACKVEFSPNGDFKETPVVYCVLDQDDDTTFVRVQRCYLAEDNQYQYTTCSDSINYPQGSISVQILQWKAVRKRQNILQKDPAATAPIRTFDFQYTTVPDKEDGLFSTQQPIYFCPTAGLLDTACIYELLVISNISGDTIARSQTSLVGSGMKLTAPNNVTLFQFSGTGNKVCNITWSAVPRARQYQPYVRFYYRDNYPVPNASGDYDTVRDLHYIDINCPKVRSSMMQPFEKINLDHSTFLSTISNALADDHRPKFPTDTVEIYIVSCTEDLAAYLYSHESTSSINQNRHEYSNIIGGLGVFSSRRTHVYFTILAPGNANSYYRKTLRELGVGFI